MNGVILEIICSDIRKSYRVLSECSLVKEAQTFGDRLNIVVQKKDDIKKVENKLNEEKIKIIDIREISPSLENVFISLVNES